MKTKSPKPVRLWSAKNRAVVVVIKPSNSKGYLLATIHIKPGQKALTRAQLNDALAGYERS